MHTDMKHVSMYVCMVRIWHSLSTPLSYTHSPWHYYFLEFIYVHVKSRNRMAARMLN